MNNAVLAGMALGVIIGAVGITLCKPAQNIVKRSTDVIRDETKSMMKKASN